uniref:Putative effector protein n=1 Tax=Heterodera avenae TaxID=34510 RepID=A0A2L0VDP3_HETAV|nr:putative effector protein [Heterodera avenae]
MTSSSCFSSSSALLSMIATVALLCKCCISAPHPCCPGSQHIVSLMHNYIDTFPASMPKSALCLRAERVAAALENQLTLIGCPNGGDQTLIKEINAIQSTNEECARSVGFVRAMFDIAASTASHASGNNDWTNLAAQFRQQVVMMDNKCTELGIQIGRMSLDTPKGSHARVPATECVINDPAKSGSHKL